MPRSYRYLHFDVFTDRRFCGNQLAVFLDGRGLTTETMQAIAGEMNFSESTFVLPAEEFGTDFRLRIFTPGVELPMAGHPTIGSAFALATAGIVEAGRREFVFGLGVGPTPISLTWQHGDLSFAWMTQGLPIFSEPLRERSGAAAALGLPETVLASPELPVQVVSCGVPYLLVPLATRLAVDQATSNSGLLESYFRESAIDASGVYLFSQEPADDRATVYSRMFAPGVGISEDPATGSASGPLGCYLVRHNVVPAGGAGAILNLQGVKMGRPSYLHVSIGVDSGDIIGVRVGGAAVLAGDGTLYV